MRIQLNVDMLFSFSLVSLYPFIYFTLNYFLIDIKSDSGDCLQITDVQTCQRSSLVEEICSYVIKQTRFSQNIL